MLQVAAHDSFVLRGGRVIDPSASRDERADVIISDGVIVDSAPRTAVIIDASNYIVTPGLMDIHVHLREPGQSHKETIATGTAAAAAGGFTLVACMPNTSPALDNADALQFVREESNRVGACTVAPVAAITKGRKGAALCDLAALKEAGAIAFSDDGDGVENDDIMRAAFEQARALGAVLIQHCEYRAISNGGVMHLGNVSRKLGLPGLDPRSEEAMIERDIGLCRETGGRYHVAHISTARAVELVRAAKAEGLPITSEVCTHHLVLTDEACAGADPNFKMHPPLRPQSDVDACRAGLLDGTIDCIVTDHAPHAPDEKERGFLKAPAGIVGLETAVALAARAMIETGLADWPDVVRWFTVGPACVIGRAVPSLQAGSQANISIIDPHQSWTVDPAQFESKGRNTPFAGWELGVKAVGTIRGRVLTRVASP